MMLSSIASFTALVQISADGIATRKPLDRSTLPDAELQELIDILVRERPAPAIAIPPAR